MPRWIRNCKLPVQTVGNIGSAEIAFFIREAMLVGGWSEFANDGDAAWTSATNILFSDLTPSPGFSVLAANPRQVTHSGGPFTQAMVDDGAVLALRASNDQNASMWRITQFINANTVRVDSFGFNPNGWVDESAIPGRIVTFRANMLDGAWVETDPPGGNNRARMEVTLGTWCLCKAEPRAGLSDFTQTSGLAIYDDDDLAMYLNAYFDGNNALFFKYDNGDNLVNVMMWGELENVASEETYPGFVFGRNATTTTYPFYQMYCDMLGPASLAHVRLTMDSCVASVNDANTTNQDTRSGRLLVNGRPGLARLRRLWAMMPDQAGDDGGWVRGSIPLVKAGHIELPAHAPVDGSGNWWALSQGCCVPRNGPYDLSLRRK